MRSTNRIVAGILAHVDAGKTTLSESMLYVSGSIRKMGRVDHLDAFLDTYELEKARGITIFSKQAEFALGEKQVTLLDTPGHVDFSAEMERTLQVLDYAILVINGADGIESHTLTLWKLLNIYEIPVFLFVNKMDQAGTDREKLLQEMEKRLDERCIEFGNDKDQEAFWDKLAMCDEHLMEQYLENGTLEKREIAACIAERKIFPVYFGSALKAEGVEEFLEGMEEYTIPPEYPEEFGAKIFKITRDAQGTRLTHMKITGGSLKVKAVLTNEKTEDGQKQVPGNREIWKEKADQIRIYSGSQFQPVAEALAGTICAVTGLSRTYSGEGLGIEAASDMPILEPVLTYEIQLPPECDVHGMLVKLRQLEEEEPHLHIVWDEQLGEIHAKVMGEIEIEILKSMILERFGVKVEFGAGSIVYKETIAGPVEGIGHFEPLRHYAEVHLLMEPGEPGSGLQFEAACSEDVLDRNWQRLVLTHLEEKKHKGVLTGSEITDMKITLVAGRAHQKHTEGGDFRQATYRAVRQGLKKAESILLEPVYEYRLEIPRESVGRALADIQKMQGSFADPLIEDALAILSGIAPVVGMRDYQMEVIAYTKGRGRLFCTPKGYKPCHNTEEIIASYAYDPEKDPENPTGSVFCAHGAGFVVPWDQVEQYMHVDSGLSFGIEAGEEKTRKTPVTGSRAATEMYDEKELEEIFVRTYGAIKRDRNPVYKRIISSGTEKQEGKDGAETRKVLLKKQEIRERYLLVDGYNIIFAWDELKELARINLEAARNKLMDILSNYQSYKKITVILVFDAYKVEGGRGGITMYHNIHVVYTKEAETADQYIEKAVHEIGHKYDVTVATSDALEQMIVLGNGAGRLSAQGLKAEIKEAEEEIRSNYLNKNEKSGNYVIKK